MKKLIKNIAYSGLSVALVFTMAVAVAFSSVEKAEAASNFTVGNTYQPSYGYSSGSTNYTGSTYSSGYYPQPVYATYGSNVVIPVNQWSQYKQLATPSYSAPSSYNPYSAYSIYSNSYGSQNTGGFKLTNIVK